MEAKPEFYEKGKSTPLGNIIIKYTDDLYIDIDIKWEEFVDKI